MMCATLGAQDHGLEGLRRQTDFLTTTLVGVHTQHRVLQEERARAGRWKIDQYRATTHFPRQSSPLLLKHLTPEVKGDPQRRAQVERAVRAALEEYDRYARSQRWPLDDAAATLAYATAVEYAVWQGSPRWSGPEREELYARVAGWLVRNEIFQGFSPEEKALFHEQVALGAYVTAALQDRETARRSLHEYYGVAPERLTLTPEEHPVSDIWRTRPGTARSGPARTLVSESRDSPPGR